MCERCRSAERRAVGSAALSDDAGRNGRRAGDQREDGLGDRRRDSRSNHCARGQRGDLRLRARLEALRGRDTLAPPRRGARLAGIADEAEAALKVAAYASAVEAVLLKEQPQWGQLTAEVEDPGTDERPSHHGR
jgi:hypothetical protein